MTAAEVAKHLRDKIGPELEELGLDAFSIAAYVRDSEGNVTRVAVVNCGKNPAYQDGLGPVIAITQAWQRGGQ